MKLDAELDRLLDTKLSQITFVSRQKAKWIDHVPLQLYSGLEDHFCSPKVTCTNWDGSKQVEYLSNAHTS